MTSRFVIGLRDIGEGDAQVVGRKAANLARLAGSGFRVPDGCAITPAACAALPARLWPEVQAHLDRLGVPSVAVRSSGTTEDLGDASYAGQYDTVLGVEGPEAVADAVRHCVASASSERVRGYAGSDGPGPMAVLVQVMVPADAAGVAFTANPVTGDDEVLVSAVAGLGDRLVSGEATPDEWVVRGDEVSTQRSTGGVLEDKQVAEIAATAREVEQLFGSPQDIEWAVAGGELFILQARPITALPVAPDLTVLDEGFWAKDTAHFPTPLTPFGASVYLPAIAESIKVFAELGMLIDGVDQLSMGGEVYGKVIPMDFADLGRRAEVAQTVMDSGLAERSLEQWAEEWQPAFERELTALRDLDLTALDDAGLLHHLDGLEALLTRGEELHFRLALPYGLSLYELDVACQELLGWAPGRSLSLVTGTSVASSEPGRMLADLARRTASDPTAADELPAFLERYGHRPTSYDPGDPTWFERPQIVRHLLAAQVGAGAGTQAPPDTVAEARAELAGRPEPDRARFEAALSFARRAYPNREDNIYWLDNYPCALLRYCAVEFGRRLAGRGLIARSDDAVYLEASELRRALMDGDAGDLAPVVARRKRERAWVIAHPGPAFYGPPPGAPPDLAPLPPALQHIGRAFQNMIGSMGADAGRTASDDELLGVAASPGRYTGPVRVVRDETEFAKLQPGDVLVCPATSPSWSLLFLQAGAVVTDGGGVLSHTAVIAREYGVPAVLATGTSTRMLHDGDLVTVDGTAGTVTWSPAGSPSA